MQMQKGNTTKHLLLIIVFIFTGFLFQKRAAALEITVTPILPQIIIGGTNVAGADYPALNGMSFTFPVRVFVRFIPDNPSDRLHLTLTRTVTSSGYNTSCFNMPASEATQTFQIQANVGQVFETWFPNSYTVNAATCAVSGQPTSLNSRVFANWNLNGGATNVGSADSGQSSVNLIHVEQPATLSTSINNSATRVTWGTGVLHANPGGTIPRSNDLRLSYEGTAAMTSGNLTRVQVTVRRNGTDTTPCGVLDTTPSNPQTMSRTNCVLNTSSWNQGDTLFIEITAQGTASNGTTLQDSNSVSFNVESTNTQGTPCTHPGQCGAATGTDCGTGQICADAGAGTLRCRSTTGTECQAASTPPVIIPGLDIHELDISKILRLVYQITFPLGIGAGMFFILKAGYTLKTSEGNPQKIKEGQDELTSAILGTLFILLSVVILRIIINSILGVTPGF